MSWGWLLALRAGSHTGDEGVASENTLRAVDLFEGTRVAAIALMTRRAGAFILIAILLVLALVLAWDVYCHHALRNVPDESGTVRMDGGTASFVVSGALQLR
jgi:hypothetical protein